MPYAPANTQFVACIKGQTNKTKSKEGINPFPCPPNAKTMPRCFGVENIYDPTLEYPGKGDSMLFLSCLCPSMRILWYSPCHFPRPKESVVLFAPCWLPRLVYRMLLISCKRHAPIEIKGKKSRESVKEKVLFRRVICDARGSEEKKNLVDGAPDENDAAGGKVRGASPRPLCFRPNAEPGRGGEKKRLFLVAGPKCDKRERLAIGDCCAERRPGVLCAW